MNNIALELKASLAFVSRNFNLVKRYINWEGVFLIYEVVNILTIGYIGYGDPQRILYLIIGSLLWGLLSVMFHSVAEAIAWERWEGTIEYTFMAPVYRFTYLIGECIFAVSYAIVRSVIVLTVVALFFKLNFTNANFGAAILIVIVSSFSFLGMGLVAATFPLLSPERGAQAAHILQAVILLISGVYYEVSVLPGWLQPFSCISPGTYTLRAMRKAMLHNASIYELRYDLVILIAIGVIFIPLGMWIFHRAELHAKRTGTLKRNG